MDKEKEQKTMKSESGKETSECGCYIMDPCSSYCGCCVVDACGCEYYTIDPCCC